MMNISLQVANKSFSTCKLCKSSYCNITEFSRAVTKQLAFVLCVCVRVYIRGGGLCVGVYESVCLCGCV